MNIDYSFPNHLTEAPTTDLSSGISYPGPVICDEEQLLM